MESFDLERISVRELNDFLHHAVHRSATGEGAKKTEFEVLNPNGQHSIAAGLNAPLRVHIRGHGGYFVAGMNKEAEVIVYGNVGWSVAENIMSGIVRVKGFASECAGASGHGGLVVVEGDASSRCGISMKGCDIVVGGNVGHMSAFMAQAGHLVVCGDADAGLGDSLYEAVIYVRGKIHGLGADAREEPMAPKDLDTVSELLGQAGFDHKPQAFKRIASAKTLYHWNADAGVAY